MSEPTYHCPKCGQELKAVLWGNMWDWDASVRPCPKCGYEGELDTMTCLDPDGTIHQFNKHEDENE